MAYARVAGHISPAGAKAAKSGANPALSRNCDAPLSGMSQVDHSAPNERRPSEEGRFVRQPSPASSSADAEVFISRNPIQSQPRPRRPHRRAAAAELSPHTVYALSWSGGKDSALALSTLLHEQREPEALITTV